MAINFPKDFKVVPNMVQFFDAKTNYIYQRPDGSIISVLGGTMDMLSLTNDQTYEVWDERFMEYPVSMSHDELNVYLKTPLETLLTNQLLSNEIILN